MCIRDRAYDKVLQGEGPTSAVETASLWSRFAAMTTAVLAPVSYTHLRAHETVLDLVCRLLLEKKKKICNSEHNCIDDNVQTVC